MGHVIGSKEESLPLTAIDNKSLSSAVSVLKNFNNTEKQTLVIDTYTGKTTSVIDCSIGTPTSAMDCRTGITISAMDYSIGKKTPVIDCSIGKTIPATEDGKKEGSDDDTEIESDTSDCEEEKSTHLDINPAAMITEEPDDLLRKRELMQALSLVELEPKSDITSSSSSAVTVGIESLATSVVFSHKRKSSPSVDKKKKVKKIRASIQDVAKENMKEQTDGGAVQQTDGGVVQQTYVDRLEGRELSTLTGDGINCKQRKDATHGSSFPVHNDSSTAECGGAVTKEKDGLESEQINRASQFSYRAGLHKEAAMTHIIHELRHYKKQLVEKIDATRCGVMLKCSGQDSLISHPTKASTDSLTNINNNNYTFNCRATASLQGNIDGNKNTISKRIPSRKTMDNASCTAQPQPRAEMSEMLSSDNNDYSDDDDDAMTSDSDSKELPDLVRSHNPSILPSSSSLSCSGAVVVPSSLIYSSFVNSPGSSAVARLLTPRHPVWSPASFAMSHHTAALSMSSRRHPHNVPGVTRLSDPITALPDGRERVDATKPSYRSTPSRRRTITAVAVDESFPVFDECGALDLSAAGRAQRLFGANMSSSQIDSVTHRSGAVITGESLYDVGTEDDCDNVLDLSTTPRGRTRDGGGNERREINNENSRHHLADVTDRSSNKRAGKRRRHSRDRSHKRDTVRPGGRDGGSGGGANQSQSSIGTSAHLSGVNSLGEVQRWATNDVVAFVSSVPGCQPYCETLQRLGVTGSSLPLLTVDLMVNALHMQPTVAGSLRLAIDKLMTSSLL